MEAQHGALAPLDLLDLVGVDEEGEGGAVGAGGGLDHVRDVALLGALVEVLELLTAELGVLGEVEVAAVGDPLQLRPADREQVLDVARGRGVVGELVGVVGTDTQVFGPDAELGVPALALLDPGPVPTLGVGRRHEELHLHLLELAGAEDEVAGGDLVAEGLADLGDAERRLLAGEAEHVLEVDEDPLRGLRPQVDLRALAGDRADVGLEHEVELAWLGELAAALRAAQLRLRVAPLRSIASRRWSSRQRLLHLPRHWTSGSVNPSRCPEASQTLGCWMIAESSATMSSRSWSIARHHSALTLFFSRTP